MVNENIKYGKCRENNNICCKTKMTIMTQARIAVFHREYSFQHFTFLCPMSKFAQLTCFISKQMINGYVLMKLFFHIFLLEYYQKKFFCGHAPLLGKIKKHSPIVLIFFNTLVWDMKFHCSTVS